MKKVINYICFFIIFLFIFIINSNAECSYQERKDLLNAAKNVDIYYDIENEVITETGVNTYGEEVTLSKQIYSFKFNIVGLTENLFIKYYNLNDGVERYINYNDLDSESKYSFKDENSDFIYTYNFEIYSANNNCVGQKMYTKKVIKPMFNGFSQYSICQKDGMENFLYCKNFITKEINISEDEFIEKANNFLKQNTEEEKVSDNVNFFNFLKNYYIYIIIVFVVIISLVSIIIVRKRRSRL